MSVDGGELHGQFRCAALGVAADGAAGVGGTGEVSRGKARVQVATKLVGGRGTQQLLLEICTLKLQWKICNVQFVCGPITIMDFLPS